MRLTKTYLFSVTLGPPIAKIICCLATLTITEYHSVQLKSLE